MSDQTAREHAEETEMVGRSPISRRVVLHGAAAGAIGVALVGCGSDEPEAGAGSPTPQTSAEESPPPSSDKPSDGGEEEGLVATDEVPVNGGVIVNDEVVVTQPEQGTFKAFSAICTHQGCVVNDVTDNVISCPCHGSQYSASDGSVEAGPAPSALSEVDVEVVDGEVVRA